jgi:HAD superfamily hydrolase (TIGR01549 family)
MTRAILFDLDDTLVGYRPGDAAKLFRAGAERVYAYLSAHELPMPAFEPFCRRQRWLQTRATWMTRLTGGEPDARRLLRKMCRDFGLQRDESCLAKLGWLWYEPLTELADVADDVRPTLALLREHDFQLGLVANTPHLGAVIDQHLSDLGLLEFFPARAYSTEIGARKPHPHLFMSALEQLGMSADEALFVGDDLKEDIAGAHRLGMRTALLSTNPPRAAAHYANHVIARIGELRELLHLPTAAAAPNAPSTAPAPAIPPLEVERAAVAAR